MVVVVVEGVDAVEVTEVASDTVMPPEVADVEDVRESTVAADEAFRDLVAGECPVGERLRDRVIFRLKICKFKVNSGKSNVKYRVLAMCSVNLKMHIVLQHLTYIKFTVNL